MSKAPASGESKNTLYCSFCGKSQHEVRKLIAGPDGVHLRRVRRALHGHHPRGAQNLAGEVQGRRADPARDQGRPRRLRGRPGTRQARALGRRAQPLQAPEPRRQERRCRTGEIEHPADRPDRLRQDAAGADAGAHHRRAVHDGGRDDADRSGLCRRRRREHHSEAAASRRLQRRARAARHRLYRRSRQDFAQVRQSDRSRATCRARACSKRC